MNNNEIFGVLADAIAHKDTHRLVVKFNGDEKGLTMLVDFSLAGDPFEGGAVCMWTIEKHSDYVDGHYVGTTEIGHGQFSDYKYVYTFIELALKDRDAKLFIESF